VLANLVLGGVVGKITYKKADCHRYLIEPFIVVLIKCGCGEVSLR
jgi:hypothetical protein